MSSFLAEVFPWPAAYPASILHKSIAGCHQPVRVADGPIMACYRFITYYFAVASVSSFNLTYLLLL